MLKCKILYLYLVGTNTNQIVTNKLTESFLTTEYYFLVNKVVVSRNHT